MKTPETVHKPTLRRKAHVALGTAKAKLLGDNIAIVVRKPGHSAYDSVINYVYGIYGVTIRWSLNRRFTRRKVSDTYEHVFRAKPHLREELMKSFASKGLLDRNICVDVVEVHKETLQQWGASNARQFLKRLAGDKDPDVALREQEESGFITIRGEATRLAKQGQLKSAPTKTNNVVHVPDPEMSLVLGWHTGFQPKLHRFVPSWGVIAAKGPTSKKEWHNP